MRTLKRGMTGNDVAYVQYKFLGITADRSFGPAMDLAVRNKQRATGLVVDGSIGPATQKKWGITDFMVDIYDKSQVHFAGTPYGSSSYPLKTLAQWGKEENASIVYNLALYNMSGSGNDQYGPIKGRTITYLKAKGRDVGYGGPSERLTIDAGNVAGAAIVGVWNGVARSVSNRKTAHNAHGFLKDGRYFQVQSVMDTTETELIRYMVTNYAIQTLFIQDGGGSVGKYDVTKKVLLAPRKEGTNGRPVASVVIIKGSPIVTPTQPKLCPTCGQPIS